MGWCNNHGFSGNQEEVTQREQLGVDVDRRGQAAAGKFNLNILLNLNLNLLKCLSIGVLLCVCNIICQS